MAKKYVFKRHELKYKLTKEQYQAVLKGVEEHLSADEYGETTVQSLYFDTDNHLLIRNSIEKPTYKEKIRARSYGLATPFSEVFLELKKKYNKVVFKRRISVKESQLLPILNGEVQPSTQIEKEIAYFCSYYENLKPAMLLLYDRTAYRDKSEDLRITFDRNIRYRTSRLSLCGGLDGELLLEPGEVMLEIKTGGAYPIWLARLLNQNKVYKTSFSKYGTAYGKELEKANLTKEEAV